MAVHQPAAGVEEGEGEEDVLRAVDEGQILVLFSNSFKFRGVIVSPVHWMIVFFKTV